MNFLPHYVLLGVPLVGHQTSCGSAKTEFWFLCYDPSVGRQFNCCFISYVTIHTERRNLQGQEI